MTEPISNGVKPQQLTFKRGQGITQALKELVEKNKMKLSDGSISKAEWQATIKVLDEIQASRKANNQASIFGNNYLVHQNDKIDFTSEEMDKLYKAMGAEFEGKPAPAAEQKPQAEQTQQAQQAQQAQQVQHAQAVHAQPAITDMHPTDQTETEVKVTSQQQQNFDNAMKNVKYADTTPSSEELSKDGYHQYCNEKRPFGDAGYENASGSKVFIKDSRAGQVPPSNDFSVTVTYNDGNGLMNAVVYDKGKKPVQGTLTMLQKNGATVEYKYTFDSAGNKVLQSCNTLQAKINTGKAEYLQSAAEQGKLPENFDELLDNVQSNFDDPILNNVDLSQYSAIEDSMSPKQKAEAAKIYSDFYEKALVTSYADGSLGTVYQKLGIRIRKDFDGVENPEKEVEPYVKTTCNMLAAGKDKYLQLRQKYGVEKFVNNYPSGITSEEWGFVCSYESTALGLMHLELNSDGEFVKAKEA